MKRTIRENVFETNSSSTHMISLSARNIKLHNKTMIKIENLYIDPFTDQKENHKVLTYEGVIEKYRLLEWLINEVSIYGDLIISTSHTYTCEKNNKPVTIKHLNEKIKNDIRHITNTTSKDDESLIINMNKMIINNEEDFFSDINYSYKVILDSDKKVIDEMNNKERTTLALKFLYLSFQYNYLFNDDSKYEEWIQRIYTDIINKTITSDFLLHEELLSSQLINANKFKEVFSNIDDEISYENLNRIKEEGKLCTDSYLDEDYDFTTLINDLHLDCLSYIRYKNSLINLINDDDIVIDIC